MKTVKKFELKVNQTKFEQIKITKSEDAANFIKQFYSDDIEIYESFFILLMNRSNKIIGYAKISQGGIIGTYVDKKIVLKYVIDSLASGLIIAHNHPSGVLKPSDEDIKITKQITELCKLLETTLLDHVILTADSFYSFADNGKL
jgi:DNA repair protein RadC